MFIGREKELQYLQTMYEKPNTQILLLYGQKGIGKTSLLKQFLADKEGIYYEAVSCSLQQQKQFLTETIALQIPSFTACVDFGSCFAAIGSQSEKKNVFIVDEFQNICRTDNVFLEMLSAFVQETQKSQNVFYILCSSSVSWVENVLFQKTEPLPQMFDASYKLTELKYKDFKQYFPHFSVNDRIQAFSILGGIPGLWKYFSDEFTLRENIEYFLLRPEEPLFHYGQQYIETELREPSVYNTLLAAVAAGKQKLNAMYLATGFSRAKISVYLKNLIQLEIIEKVSSLETEGKDKAKKGTYAIRHPYVRFYYRYLFGRQTQLFHISAEKFYDSYISPSLREYASDSFCQVCAEFLERKSAEGSLPGTFENIGKWVGKTGTIDLLFRNEDDEILAGVCDYTKDMMVFEDYERLQKCLKDAKIEADYMTLFSTGNFDNRLRQERKKHPELELILLKQIE